MTTLLSPAGIQIACVRFRFQGWHDSLEHIHVADLPLDDSCGHVLLLCCP